MFDCSKDVIAYHKDDVTLRQSDCDSMRQRRNSNQARLANGLKKNDDPAPLEHVTQGSYEMKTMVQHPDNDYDIDDGVYFEKDGLVGKQGGDKSALDTRKMIRDAVDDGSFKTPPEVKTNCVRVQYDTGYHVDLPAYRRVTETDIFGNETTYNELASSSWMRSDARDVTSWFNRLNQELSPDTTNGRQVRRVVRLIKKYSKSRSSWESKNLSGFGITKLVTECYRANENREDMALHDTMEAIRDRLNGNLVVDHPVTPDATITTGDEDPKAIFLREKLSEAIKNLEPLFEFGCTREKALKCWDKVFATKYFTDRDANAKKSESSAKSMNAVSPFGVFSESRREEIEENPVQKQGGGRFGTSHEC
ncbi:hypothetical protein FF011L_01360 [Roseimaritima multifibrata]|uniref:Cyclic GMP-AMP synthase n=1 Tax=Roseimaritima multifibrata TaxID=1930274 RepID=A0A517M943_9BACT|nr:hypothetical protein [Roseimaritima multifibrata]QDS91406.1 hypothetical protein FF011L_01360 [Roseimaritima multifibrata]